MNLSAVRSRFIQENLARALQAKDKELAERALHAFHRYFQWFGNSLPDLERLTILGQLARLEAEHSIKRTEEATLTSYRTVTE